jgi:hypothetical protein
MAIKVGQPKVNKAARDHAIRSEVIGSTNSSRDELPGAERPEGSTLNPKVAGSIPARPIDNCLQMRGSWSPLHAQNGHKINIQLLTHASRREKTRTSSSGPQPFAVPRSSVYGSRSLDGDGGEVDLRDE